MSLPSLHLEQALRLYEILGAYVPKEIDEDVDGLDFIGQIVHNVIAADQHRQLILATALMAGRSPDEMLTLSSEELLGLFSSGLSANHIYLLCRFCEGLKYGGSG